ncbi:peptidoglycan-binding domain-containing protein [Shewanella gaetbuli]|uniref:Peptidoglycan-binding protein n=1 Tax=Shewanella gaetbuli TaxID=220752 RepID=A0A9X2CF74_9GAMM|nr:peptidoglycan-binding protein [Shewanella gaetbuli]MCL1141123.1 peptidoglycan-binding protein [Shewanella gaetbuli]
MVKSKTIFFKYSALSTSIALLLSACSTTPQQEVSSYSAAELEARNQALLERETAIAKREALAQEVAMQSSLDENGELLPPNANAGECYARVWVEPTYEQYTEQVLVKEASQRIEVIPAQYETALETVTIQPASYKIVAEPATYDTLTEQKVVQEAGTQWLVDLKKGSAPASSEILKAASDHGINLSSAEVGMCYHEHYLPAKYEEQNESVLISEAYEKVDTVPAEFRWVEKRILIKEASTRIEEVPAQYETVTENVVDIPAHTIWKKGTGPIQKIDEATGEIMCLVEVPATYKAVNKRVLVSPATTKTIEIPAEYETVKVQELVSEVQEIRTQVPAEYKDLTVTKKVSDVKFVWHEVHNLEHPSSTRTGNKICLTETPAKYETVTRQVVVQPASTKRIEIPAKYETVKIDKLVNPAQEKRIDIPAEYETVTLNKVSKNGFMEWRPILCETNMTRSIIMDIQQALASKGYNPGKVDGVFGHDTIKAVNAFQKDNNLPTDQYINMETIKALGPQFNKL